MVKGAPEAILPRCADVRFGTDVLSLDMNHWQTEVERLSAEGMRTLAVAFMSVPATDEVLDHNDIAEGLTLLGVVGIIDPPREEAISAVEDCHSAGIRVKMITGNHALTARAIAAQIGIGNGRDVLTGTELDLPVAKNACSCLL